MQALRMLSNVDIDKAAEVLIRVFEAPPFSYGFLSKGKIVSYLSDIRNTPGFVGYVLEDGSETGAYCFGLLCDYFAAPYYEIKEIFVRPDYQGRGVGSFFLGKIEEDVKKLGARTISLNTSDRIPACSFYLKNGYDISEAAVHMYKQL